MNKATKKTKKVFSNLKTNGTNRKFIIFLKLKAKRIKKQSKKQKKINNAENKTKKLEKKIKIATISKEKKCLLLGPTA